MKGIDRILRDGDVVRIGEQYFEVYHITAHSYDSICLFGEQEGLLFAGDTTFPIEFENEVLRKENEQVLSRLGQMNINTVYHGHGPSHSYNNINFPLIKSKENGYVNRWHMIRYAIIGVCVIFRIDWNLIWIQISINIIQIIIN